jgi:predicted nucleic acid-binding protein
MSGVLVDSDVIIEVLRQRNAEIMQNWVDLADSRDAVTCSPISVAEVFHGMRDGEKDAVKRAFSKLICVPVDQAIGLRAAAYLRLYYQSHALALGDAIIAATASMHELRLWTQNRKHFPMKDLKFFASKNQSH